MNLFVYLYYSINYDVVYCANVTCYDLSVNILLIMSCIVTNLYVFLAFHFVRVIAE